MRGIINACAVIVQAFSLIIILRFALSWFVRRPTVLTRFIDKVLDPPLSPIRRLLRRLPVRLPFDISPVIAVVILIPIRGFLMWLLWKM